MNGSKQKSNIEDRLEMMNSMLDEYLAENCADMVDNLEDDITDDEFSLDGAPQELQKFAQNFIDDKRAVECLVLSAGLSVERHSDVVEWYKKHGAKALLDDCLYYKSIVIDNDISEGDEDLAIYIYAIKHIEDNNIQIDVDDWIETFKNEGFKKDTVLEKKVEVENSIASFERVGD